MGKQSGEGQPNDMPTSTDSSSIGPSSIGSARQPAPPEESASPPKPSLPQSPQGAWNPTPDPAASPLATMLLEAAVRFVDLPAAQFDEVISQTLNQLAAHVQMEHVGLSLMQEGQGQLGPEKLGVGRRYVAGGTYLPSADELATPYPWYAAQLRAGNLIILPNGPDDLPPEAETERAYGIAQGVKCSLVIPLRIGEQLIGSLYFNSTTHSYTWPALDLHALTLFARVLAGAAQRKQSEDVLRRNEEHLALAIDAAGVGIWSWDLEHPERSYASENLSKIHGIYPCPKEQSLQIYLASLHPEDFVEMQQLAMRCMNGEVADFTVEHRLIWPDGSTHWVEARGYVVRDATGRPTRLTGVMQEISQRKAVETQVEQQRQELLRQARMMEQTERLGQIGGWEWDMSNDLVYWTPETYHIFGVSPTEHTPTFTASLNFFTPASATILSNAIRRATEAGEEYDLKLQIVNVQGKTLWVRLSGRIDVVDGQVVRLYGSVQDITLRTEIEEQLREAQKMEAIGQLAGGIAHDFNNLHTAINGMSELALLYLDKAAATTAIDRVRVYIGEIHRAGKRAAELTNQLLAFSRKQILRPKVLDLRLDVTKAQSLLQQILGEKIELILKMPSHLGLVMVDPSQIEQVIINLAINARDAMPDGGTLTIRLSNVTIDAATARQQQRLHPGDYVVLEVQDSGHGMTPEVQARLFDPFFTTKSVGTGSGLGLATVYGIVKQSGGTIEVESQLAVGSIFRIFLPESTPSPQEIQTPKNYVRGGTETVLLVDEDAMARHTFRTALETKGYRVLDSAGGRAAIALCQGYIGPIHVLVAKATMSEMSGVALANQSFLFRPELRVLLLLERGEELESAYSSAQSVYFSLKKPYNLDILAAKVRSVLDAPASMVLL